MTVVLQSPPTTAQPEALHISELLDFRSDQGVIRLQDQRVVLLSAAAMGLLRKELIDSLGAATARCLFLRFGYADGYHDAVGLRNRSCWTDRLEGLRAGIALQRLEGIVRADILKLDYDAISGRFEEDVVWHNSYVAEQHVHHYGCSTDPVCWSLVGYISGYASACLQQEIYFREVQCAAQGATTCVVTGKDAAGWGAELERLRADFRIDSLGDEVERLRDLVRRRPRPVDEDECTAARDCDMNLLRERVVSQAAARHFIAGSAAIQDVLELGARVAPLDTTVLVQGESGTGKEFIVRMIHDQSPRADGPFVSINCAALTETLLESELFGHVRGAFTGAVRDKTGLFEAATNGTLFLDEIGEVAPAVQAKLLRALQEREIRKVGSERNVRVNARVIAATNRDLRAAVAAGTFREDLYFRLGGFVMSVPPLRDRRDDIPALVQHFVRWAAERMQKDVRSVSPEAMTALMNYRWPGNIRELQHAIERAVIVTRGTNISSRDLPPEIWQRVLPPVAADSLDLHAQERVTIERALRQFQGNRRETAAALKISTVTLWRKIKQYGLAV